MRELMILSTKGCRTGMQAAMMMVAPSTLEGGRRGLVLDRMEGKESVVVMVVVVVVGTVTHAVQITRSEVS